MTIVNFDANLAYSLGGFTRASQTLAASVERLTSGYRINHGTDYPKGIIDVASLEATAGALNSAQGNAVLARNLLETATLGLEEIRDVLLRMQAIATRAAADSGTLSTTEADQLQTEFDALRTQISAIADSVEFNNIGLLSGSFSAGVTVLVGPDFGNANLFELSIQPVTASYLVQGNSGLLTALVESGPALAASANEMVSYALDYLNMAQNLVTVQAGRLEQIDQLLQAQEINHISAQSQVQDADLASEVATFTRAQIISESAVAIAAQANLQPQKVIRLIDKML